MERLKSFADFSRVNEGVTVEDAKKTIKDIFDKFDGIVDDKYLKDMWKKDSTLRNLYGKKLFDKAWDELMDDGKISTEDGQEWCWCSKKKQPAEVNEWAKFDDIKDSELKKLYTKLDGETDPVKASKILAKIRAAEDKHKNKLTESKNEPVDITDQLTDEDAEGCEQIESPNEFNNRYQLKDGRIVDVTPNGKYLLVTESKKEKEDCDEEKEDCDDKKEDKKKDKKEDKKEEDKKEEKDDKGKSDEEKYLSPKQRKLPEGLKKSIIARAKKAKK